MGEPIANDLPVREPINPVALLDQIRDEQGRVDRLWQECNAFLVARGQVSDMDAVLLDNLDRLSDAAERDAIALSVMLRDDTLQPDVVAAMEESLDNLITLLPPGMTAKTYLCLV